MKKVLGIGNALVDIMTRLESDAFLEKFGLAKGSMQLVDGSFSDRVIEETRHLKREQTSGGSAANAIHGLARMGVDCAFIGKIGNDDFGKFFSEDMREAGISPLLLTGKEKTGRAVALVSDDSERTFATFLGAAVELDADDLSPEIFRGYDMLHIEGYLVQNYSLVRKAVQLARDQNMQIALDLASFNVVEQHKEFLGSLVREYVDIVFANEDEAHAFTGSQPLEAVAAIAGMCGIAVVKTGENGSLIQQAGALHRIEAIPAQVTDTTGAGDLYAAGFIYGLLQGFTLDRCGRIGSLLAGHVIENTGAKIEAARWEKIRGVAETGA